MVICFFPPPMETLSIPSLKYFVLGVIFPSCQRIIVKQSFIQMTYKKLRLIAWTLFFITILIFRGHITITKNYYYSHQQQKLMRTETIIELKNDKTASEP